MIYVRWTLQAVAAVLLLAVFVNAQQATQPAAPATQPAVPATQPPATSTSAPAATAAASKCPAPTPPATLSAYTFGGTTGVLLHQVPTTKVQDFETFLGYLRDALAKSTDPTVRQQAKGWRIYRDATPGPNNDVVYVFLLDPAVPCVDYSLGPIIAGAIPDPAERKRVWNLYSSSLRQSALMDLGPVPVAPQNTK